jgi:hypothetical protein
MITADTESRELTHGETAGFEHGWWVDLRTWGLGIDVSREVEAHLWPSRFSVSVQIGPLSWAVSREWRRAS